jgi:hypothetical protein
MLRVFFLLFTLCFLCSATPLITKEFLEEVKQKATWTVTNYEENVFKGIEDEDVTADVIDPYALNSLRESDVADTSMFASNSEAVDCALPVQDMKDLCFGSSFAFAIAGMTSMRCCAKKNENFGWLSPMELVSCDTQNYGCAGGWPVYAAKYVEQNGLVPDECYPYNGQNEGCPLVCKKGGDFKAAHVCKATNVVTLRSLDDAKKALEKGPIVVSFEAYADFFAYKNGTYCHTTGSFKRVISLLATGFSDKPKPYLTFQTPYGVNFGEKGFIKMCTTCCGMFGKYEKGNVALDIA